MVFQIIGANSQVTFSVDLYRGLSKIKKIASLCPYTGAQYMGHNEST